MKLRSCAGHSTKEDSRRRWTKTAILETLAPTIERSVVFYCKRYHSRYHETIREAIFQAMLKTEAKYDANRLNPKSLENFYWMVLRQMIQNAMKGLRTLKRGQGLKILREADLAPDAAGTSHVSRMVSLPSSASRNVYLDAICSLAWKHMTPQERELIEMRIFHGMSFVEIMSETDLGKYDTVRRRTGAAVEKFREIIRQLLELCRGLVSH